MLTGAAGDASSPSPRDRDCLKAVPYRRTERTSRLGRLQGEPFRPAVTATLKGSPYTCRHLTIVNAHAERRRTAAPDRRGTRGVDLESAEGALSAAGLHQAGPRALLPRGRGRRAAGRGRTSHGARPLPR